MADLDAPTLARRALDLKLVTNAQLQECRKEIGKLEEDPYPLCRALERKGYLTPWQTHKLLKGDSEGFFLGGYILQYRIAAGSFGRVFRAEDPKNGSLVAIKVLRKRHTEDQHQVDLFEREGKVGLTLQHANIVKVISVSRDPESNQYYIVMEFVEGGNLRDFLAIRKRLDPLEALKLMEDAVSGLSYAYSRGVTHRDIKPTNILISAQRTAKLVDFGLAGLYTSPAVRSEEQVDRTVDYAGLERATGVKPGDVRSDIYFLGCVLYEMLTGRFPLMKPRDKRARMLKQRFESALPVHPDEVDGKLAVIRLVETMMSLNPQTRYQNPSQLLQAIRDVRRDVDKSARPAATEPMERSVFVVEKNERIQNLLRTAFKDLGYRVLMSADPATAISRFRQQAFDGMVVDAAALGEDAVWMFRRLMTEAQRSKRSFAGILLLAQEQSKLADEVISNSHSVVMVRPFTLKALGNKLCEIVPPRQESKEAR
jgi:serine/threonine protein kinase